MVKQPKNHRTFMERNETKNTIIDITPRSTAEKTHDFFTKIVFFGGIILTLAVAAFSFAVAGFMLMFFVVFFLIVYPVFLLSSFVYWKYIKKQPAPEWLVVKFKTTYRPGNQSKSRSFATDPRYSSGASNIFHKDR